jgi:outer membrane protein OmpA-like peptidoglycan-associated protein/tetratricopeptide (TPR) repeat protein
MLKKIRSGGFLFSHINTCTFPENILIRLFALAIFLTLGISGTSAQNRELHTRSDRAFKSYNNGVRAYDFLDFKSAEAYFRTAIDIDDKFYEAYLMLGELFSKQRRYSEAVVNYRRAVSLDSLFYKPVFFALAQAELMTGRYAEASVHYRIYLEFKTGNEKNMATAVKNLKNCEFALNAMKKPVPFNPVNIGDSINTKDDEYWPSITADGQTLMFTRQINSSRNDDNRTGIQEDFYFSRRQDSVWLKAKDAGRPLNTSHNEGAMTLSPAGDYMYFTCCERPGGLGSCDIYFSSFDGKRWTEPVNAGPPVNTKSWESQPSISADGKMLFLSSNRAGGYGGMDIWYLIMNSQGKWVKPRNAGSKINSADDEMSPFIHFDGKTLYFSSDGHPGMGGFDIYETRMLDDSSWSEPQNLGYPINTYNDEMGLVIESGGMKAYFSSKRDNIHGKDIFTFDLHESVRPDPVSYLKGKVFDKETGAPLKAIYNLTNLSTGNVAVKNSTDDTGGFLVCLPSGYNYGLNVSRTGYLFYSENFMLEGKHSAVEPFLKTIWLSSLKVGEKLILANVFYEFDSWELRKESVEELNKLFTLLSDNKEFVVEIGGYTDSYGSDDYNLSLSEKRAKSVVDYLIKKGISPERLKFKGYGNTSPIGDNITTEGRQLNRRTEVRIIEKKQKK